MLTSMSIISQFTDTTVRFFAALGDPCDPSSGGFLGFPPWHKYLGGTQTVAGDPTQPLVCVPKVGALSDIWLILAAVIELLLRFAALAAIFLIVYGGIQLITSQGDSGATKKARQTIINAVVGLIIAIAATSIISFIAGRF